MMLKRISLFAACFLLIFSCGRKSSSVLITPKLENEKNQSTTGSEQSTPEDPNSTDETKSLKWENPDLWPSSSPYQKSIKRIFSPLAASWSEIIYSTIKNKTPELLSDHPADDIKNFCTRFDSINKNQRLIFWAHFFVSVAFEESGWNPLSVNFERRAGYTKSASEGLLQISHPDAASHDLNCGFDWNIDKNLAPNDFKKTILNPSLNLSCGIQILARELDKKHRIQVLDDRSDLVYWSVLFNGKSAKALAAIKKSTQSLQFCR